MGLLDFFRKKALKPTFQRPDLNFKLVGNHVVYYEIDWETFITKGYRGNPDVFTIISDLARRRAEAPMEQHRLKSRKNLKRYLHLVSKGKTNTARVFLIKALGEEIESSPVLDLLNRPNAYQSRKQFIEMISICYDALGDVVIWATRGTTPLNKGIPIELHVLPAYDVDPISDRTFRGVKGYLIKSLQKEVPAADIFHWIRPNLQINDAYHPQRGMSPMEPGARVLQKANASEEAAVDLFESRGGRGAVFFDDPNVDTSEVDFNDEQSKFNSKIYGKSNKGRWFWSNTKLGSIDLSKDAGQLDILGQQKYSTLQICRIFGYDETLLANEHKSLNNFEEAVKRIITNAVLPWQSSFAEALSAWLLPYFDQEDTLLKFDETYYPELNSNIKDLGPVLEGITFLSDNEKRAYFNEAPYPHPNADTLLKKQGMIPIEDLGLLDLDAGDDVPL